MQVSNNSGGASVFYNTIQGNVQVNGNAASSTVGFNTIQGNVQVDKNTGSTSFVQQNTIGGNLSCRGNKPGVTNGGFPNTVAGHEQGQCAGL